MPFLGHPLGETPLDSSQFSHVRISLLSDLSWRQIRCFGSSALLEAFQPRCARFDSISQRVERRCLPPFYSLLGHPDAGHLHIRTPRLFSPSNYFLDQFRDNCEDTKLPKLSNLNIYKASEIVLLFDQIGLASKRMSFWKCSHPHDCCCAIITIYSNVYTRNTVLHQQNSTCYSNS